MAEVELPNLEELEEVRAKGFTRRAALTTGIFAVLLAVTSLGGNNAMKEMLLAQQQSSDQWAFYQAKAMRQHLYALNAKIIEAELADRGPAMGATARARYEELQKELRSEATRFEGEKKKIEEEAKRLEEERDHSRTKDPYFDYAEVLLQIAIVLASIAILAVSRPVYLFAVVSATLGSFLMLNGYLLFVRLPFLH